MKIAIDCRMSGKSGIGAYLDALLPYFLQTHECLLFGDIDRLEFITKDVEIVADLNIIDCTIKPFSIRDTLFLPWVVLSAINSCDVYYSPYCNVPAGIRIPIYTTIHDVVFLDIVDLAGKVGTFARKCFYRRAMARSRVVFTVSQFSKERILHHLVSQKKQKEWQKRIPVTYNACKDYFMEDTEGINLRRVFEDDNIRTLLFVGNVKKHKGLGSLLEALSILMHKGLDLRLVIVGNIEGFRTKDDEFATLLKKVATKVMVREHSTLEELREWYHSADVLVQPSLYEGFGMPPLEAMNCQMRCVISDIAVFQEVYAGFPVLFFKAGDAKDMACKIEEALGLPPLVLPSKLLEKYTFEKSFKIIDDAICG